MVALAHEASGIAEQDVSVTGQSKWHLARAKRAIIVAGCCGMAYTQLTTSPATVQFARSMGATGVHIGILGALPIGLVCVQLLAALAVNRLRYRKPLWFWLSIVQRLVFLPAALGPWLFPQISDATWIWTLIALTAVNHTMLHFGTPLWLSWMGDYLPHKGLNQFWGQRHSAQQWISAVALLTNALLFFRSGVDMRAAFATIIALGAALGVIDILLFIKVDEPPVEHLPQPRLWDILAGPFRNRDFRGFIYFSCFWNMAAMVGAPFISMFLLEHVGMDLFHILLLWTISWVGGAVLSHSLGKWAERFGQRPVLVLCTAFKSINMLALLACPRDPTTAFWILAPVFMVDAFLNAGIAIANNGFMIKNSPRENRTMYIAAGTGFAGIIGGATSILAGFLLAASEDWTVQFGTWTIVNFHVLFAASVVLRLAAAVWARQVREPACADTRFVVAQLIIETRQRLQLSRVVRYWRRDAAHKSLAGPRRRRSAVRIEHRDVLSESSWHGPRPQ